MYLIVLYDCLNFIYNFFSILLGYVPITDCFREYDTDLYLGKVLLKTYELSILDRIIY